MSENRADSHPSGIKPYSAIQPYVHPTSRNRRTLDEEFDEPPIDEQPPGWEFYGSRGRAYEAGRRMAEWDRLLPNIEYSLPEWPAEVVGEELRLIRRHLQRQAKETRRQFYAKLLSQNTYSLAIAVALIGLCNLYTTLAPTLNLPLGPYVSKGFLGTTDAIYNRKIQVGDRIAGYEVTSGFGDRSDPMSGETKNHKGADLAMPVGTGLYGLGTGGKVECLQDPDGYGSYAVLTAEGLPYEFIYAHLSRCQSGSYKPGSIVALSGNSGKSTGPHLHFEMRANGEAIAPTEGYAWWAIQGNAPKPHGINPAHPGFGGVSDFAERIKAQESSGRVNIVNEVGAAGLYQITRETMEAVAPDCIGRPLTQEEFLADPTLQLQIAQCYWKPAMQRIQQETPDAVQQCRKLASYHYSGDEDASESTASQGTAPDGTPYPTIAEYADAICGR